MTKKDNIQYDYNVGWKPKTETIYLGGEDADVCAYKKTPKLDLSAKEAVPWSLRFTMLKSIWYMQPIKQ